MEANERKIEKKDYEILMDKITESTKRNNERISNVIGKIKERTPKTFDMNYLGLLDNMNDVISLVNSITSNTHVAYKALMEILNTIGQTDVSDYLLILIENNLDCIDRIVSIAEKGAVSINVNDNKEEKSEIIR